MKKEGYLHRKRNIAILTGIIILLVLLCMIVTGITVKAAGLVDETIDAGNLYSRYGLDNYQLDYYVDMSWTWLPWNWDDGVDGVVNFNFYSITNGIWLLSTVISNATGYVVQEAYQLDFIGDMADSIGRNIQTLAGVSERGFASEGFYPGLLLFVIAVVGVYVMYVGLIKRETSRAVSAVANMLVIFILSTAFIACAPSYIRNINEFSSDISMEALSIGTKLVMPGSVTDNSSPEDAVSLMRDNLFSVQIYQPWMILQYGTSDAEKIGTERVESILGVSPFENYGRDRRENVKYEIETYGNMYMTTTGIVKRFGMVFFIFILNFIISIFVLLLCGIMILSQVMFIIFAMFLPVSFILSMFPTYNGMAKKAVVRVFNIIMMRAGITLIVTVALSISSMLYSLSSGFPFFLTAFLQIVVFAGIYAKLGEILGMFGLQDEGNSRRRGGMIKSATRYIAIRKLFGRHAGSNRGVNGTDRSNGNKSNGMNANRENGRRFQLVGKESPQPEENNSRRYQVTKNTPHLSWHTEGSGKEAVVSSVQHINADKEAMEKYRGMDALRRKMHGEDIVNMGEKVLQNKKFHASEGTPDLRWWAKDGEVVSEQHIDATSVMMGKYREKAVFKRKLYENSVSETVNAADVHGKDRTFKTGGRPPKLAPEVNGGVIMAEQRIDADAGSMGKYREKGQKSRIDIDKVRSIRKTRDSVINDGKPYHIPKKSPELFTEQNGDGIITGQRIDTGGKPMEKYHERKFSGGIGKEEQKNQDLGRKDFASMGQNEDHVNREPFVANQYGPRVRTPKLVPDEENNLFDEKQNTVGGKNSMEENKKNRTREYKKDMKEFSFPKKRRKSDTDRPDRG